MNAFHIVPGKTPGLIRKLLGWTLGITLVSAVLNPFFEGAYAHISPENLLSLSRFGLSNYYWFQPITHLFVQNSGFDGVSFGWIFQLIANLYLLWAFGSPVADWMGNRPFLKFYFAIGALSALLSLLFLPFGTISGTSAIVLALFFFWTMMVPKGSIFLFSLIPVTGRGLFTGLFLAYLYFALSDGGFAYGFHLVSATLFSWVIGVLGWGFKGPWGWLEAGDAYLLRAKSWVLGKEKMKIFSFKTEEELLSDDEFVDEMLKKISKNGERSLSQKERERLDSLSKK